MTTISMNAGVPMIRNHRPDPIGLESLHGSPQIKKSNVFLDQGAAQQETSTPSLTPQMAAQLSEQLVNMQDYELFYYYNSVSSDGTISPRADKLAEFNALPPDVARAIVKKLTRADAPDKAYFALLTLLKLIKGSSTNSSFGVIFDAEVKDQIRELATKSADFLKQVGQTAIHNADGSIDYWIAGRMPWNAVHVAGSQGVVFAGATTDPLPSVEADAIPLANAIAANPTAWGLAANASSSEVLELAQARLTMSKNMNKDLADVSGAVQGALEASSTSSAQHPQQASPSSSGGASSSAGSRTPSASPASVGGAGGLDKDGHLRMTGDAMHDFAATVYNDLDADGELSAFLNGTLDPEKYTGAQKDILMAGLQRKLDAWANFMKTLTNLINAQHDIQKDIIQNFRV